jgi:cell division protein FtsL
MAAWSAAAHADRAPVPRARARPRARPTRAVRPRKRVTGGVFWIGLVAALLAGVVAMNVAVLRLNMKLDRLGRERASLQAENAALSSQLSSAAATGRIQRLAMKRLGFVPASPQQTRFVHVGR